MTSPLYSNQGRIFIRLPGGQYTYYGNAKLTGVSKSYGEAAPVYGQDRIRAGRFQIIDRIPNTEENFWTTTMTGHMDAANSSQLAQVADNRCSIDIQVHYGLCNDPTDFTDYDSAVILEGCRLSQYQTTDLVALEPKDTTVIQETVNISATTMNRLVPRKLSLSGLSTDTGVVADLCTYRTSCAVGCDPNGCGRIYALKVINLSAPPFSLKVAWSDDNGVTFNEVTLNYTLAAASNVIYRTFHIAATKDYVVIFAPNDSLGYEIVVLPHTSFVASATTLTPTTIAHGTNLDSVYTTFAAGGAVYYTGYNSLVARVSNQLLDEVIYEFPNANNAVYAGSALDADNMILFYYRPTAGEAHQIVKLSGGPFVATQMNTASLAATSVYSTEYTDTDFIVYAAAMIDKDTWLLGNSLGDVMKTTDGGQSWRITRSFSDKVVSIKMASPSIGYLITSFAAGVWRTVDAGETWAPVLANASWPTDITGDRLGLTALHVCTDPNSFFVAGGHGGNSDRFSPSSNDGGQDTTVVLGYGAE